VVLLRIRERGYNQLFGATVDSFAHAMGPAASLLQVCCNATHETAPTRDVAVHGSLKPVCEFTVVARSFPEDVLTS
jgi:hypothetical protein